jgi:hypothetical protein
MIFQTHLPSGYRHLGNPDEIQESNRMEVCLARNQFDGNESPSEAIRRHNRSPRTFPSPSVLEFYRHCVEGSLVTLIPLNFAD